MIHPTRITIEAPGDLGSVILVASPRRAPGPGELEIAVETAALNFKDVLLALGLVGAPGDSVQLGSECAGHVAAVGPGVSTFRVGDPVVALARGCLAHFVTVPVDAAVRPPTQLDSVEAVTLPAAGTTAEYALTELGRLRAGEHVLIHAAAGGVGLAALQVARRVGAVVHATAGSAAKRSFLHDLGVRHVMDSRSLAFTAEVRTATGGRGVDVVLNALSGPFTAAGLAALAPGGRLVELGVRDVLADTPLGMGAFRAGVSLCVVGDRDALPGTGDRLARLFAAVARGELAPLPYRVFPAGDAVVAMRHLAGAHHVGKVVLRFAGDPSRDPTALVVPREFTRACSGAAIEPELADARPPSVAPVDAALIRPLEGADVFARALACGWSQVVISTTPLAARLAHVSATPTLHVAPGARPTPPRPRPDTPCIAPRTDLEEALAGHWRDALGVDAVGVHDDFFELGGDSLLAVQVLARARRTLTVDLPPHSLVELPTIAGLAARVTSIRGATRTLPDTLVCLRPGRAERPLFLVHPVGGQVYVYRDLVAALPRDRAVYGIQARTPAADEDTATTPALAAAYLHDLRTIQPRGPYLLGGSSFGGVLAYEMARQIRGGGDEVAVLAMLDAPGPGCLPALFEDDAAILGYLLCQGRPQPDELARLRGLSQGDLIAEYLTRAGARPGPVHAASVAEVIDFLGVWRANQRALWTYQPPPYPGRILFFAATDADGVNVARPERAWIDRAPGLEVHAVPGTHISMNYPPNVGVVAEILGRAIARALTDIETSKQEST